MLRLPLLQRAAGPRPAATSMPGAGRRPRQPRRDRLRGRAPRPAARSACSPRAAGCSSSASSTCPTLPDSRQRPQPPGRAAAQRDAPARRRRARARAHLAGHRRTRASRSAPAQGVVKRVNPEVLGRDEWDVISLKDGDEVVGAVELATGDETLCFITSDAQLLHFGADGVRPQGRSGGGIAGVRLAAGERVGVVRRARPRDVRRRHRSGSSTALPGTEPGAVKVTPFTEYPPKGRATGGVRCHRFLKGEDTLVFAWAGTAPPARRRPAAPRSTCPRPTGRRDGSGVPGQPADRGRARDRSRRASRTCRPVCKADRMPARAAARPPRASCRRPAAGRLQRRREGGRRRPDPRGGPRAAATTLDETSGVSLTLTHRGPARGRDRIAQGRRRRRPTRRPSRARSRWSSPAPTSTSRSIAVDGKVYAQLPFTDRLPGHRPGDYGAPDPAAADEPRRRLLAPCCRHRGRRGGRDASAAARTTRRSSPSTPAPCPATREERHPERRRATFDADVHRHRRRRAARGRADRRLLPRHRRDDLHRRLRRLRHEKDITAP